ncbi:MAG: hypothetical protein KAU62_07905 [Candidatus Heimdallarchaeota archaeon]|nr:hypothetical protein [Candidatus Heimdallarchaeota archaeon]MCK4611064.1 hypothetical protein [Candidatus Heimdallarchaeota archaeon]
MRKQRNTLKRRTAYLATLILATLFATMKPAMAWFDFNLLTGGSATAIIVILSIIAAAVVYAKFFRGSATKLFSKIKRSK